MWSVFENEFKTKVDDKYQWVKKLNFYYGDLSEENLTNDWRFKEVPERRKQVKFLGTVETEFPVKFPLILNNGLVLEDTKDYHRHKTYDENSYND